MCSKAFIAAAVAGLVTACSAGGEPLIILQNQLPQDQCVLDASESGEFLFRGIIDTRSASGYIFNPLVQNNALNVEDQDNLRIANVEGAEIRITTDGVLSSTELSAADSANLLHFTRRFSGSVRPEGGTTVFSFTAIDKALLDLIGPKLGDPDQRSEIQVEVTIFGKMGGGGVESIPFTFPVDVCNGCMQVSVGACADLADGFEPLEGGVCNPLQDVITQCCDAADNSLTCPAVKPTEPVST